MDSMNLQFTHSHILTESNFPNILININGRNKIHFFDKNNYNSECYQECGERMISNMGYGYNEK